MDCTEPRALHQSRELILAQEHLRAICQPLVFIRRRDEGPADPGHQMREVQMEEGPDQHIGRIRALQADEKPARAQDPDHLLDAPLEIRQVAQAEARGHHIETLIRKSHVQGVLAADLDVGSARRLKTPLRDLQHVLAQIACHDTCFGQGARKRQRDVARAARHIEHRPGTRLDDATDQRSLPCPVPAETDDVVHVIVVLADLLEDLRDARLLLFGSQVSIIGAKFRIPPGAFRHSPTGR
ncbi:MAG: hypothetical protein FWC48_03480 [Actinomycetia bacterium]|nr:hypothetical protein [Actinomycetes bacterium]